MISWCRHIFFTQLNIKIWNLPRPTCGIVALNTDQMNCSPCTKVTWGAVCAMCHVCETNCLCLWCSLLWWLKSRGNILLLCMYIMSWQKTFDINSKPSGGYALSKYCCWKMRLGLTLHSQYILFIRMKTVKLLGSDRFIVNNHKLTCCDYYHGDPGYWLSSANAYGEYCFWNL